MKQLLIGLLIGICVFGGVLQPKMARAVDTNQLLKDAGVVVALDPPQASAEALLKLPTAYALPGTFSYWLKNIIDQIQLIFTSDPADRAELLLAFSKERLAEGYDAVKSGKAEAALASLERYQNEQIELTTALSKLQDNDIDITPYMNRLNEQLGIQNALQDFVQQEVEDGQAKDKITQLLDISPVQHLAWQQYSQSALLGERDIRRQDNPQSTTSATPQASQSAKEDRK